MMRLLKILLLLLIPVLAGAESQPDAVYTRMAKSFSLNTDGSMVYHYSHTLKLNSYFAVSRQYGETFITCDTTCQELKILNSVTTMADGKKVPSPANAFNRVLPAMAANAPAYNHLREMVVTHTGLEIGAVIDLEYTITTKSGYLPGLSHMEELHKEIPTDTLIIRITVPGGHTLRTDIIGKTGLPFINETGTELTHEWQFIDLPAKIDEAASLDASPLLMFSSMDTWDQAVSTMFGTEISSNDISSTVLPWFETFKKENTTDLEFLLSVQKTVTKDVGLLPVSLAAAGYKARHPDAVWKSGAGTLIEKALLLKAICEGYKYPARLWLVSMNPRLNEQIPVPELFTEPLVEVTMGDGKPVFLNVSKPQVYPELYAHEGDVLLTLEDGKPVFKRIDVRELNPSSISIRGMLELGTEQPGGSLNCTFRGGFNPFYRLIKKEDGLKTHLSGKSHNMKIRSADIKTLSESVLEADIDITQETHEYTGGQVIWKMPDLENPLAEIHHGSPRLKRTNTLRLSFPVESAMELKIKKPADWKPLFTDTKIIRENALGTVEIEIEIRKTEMSIKRKLNIRKTEIAPVEYDQFLELWRIWESPNYREFVFFTE